MQMIFKKSINHLWIIVDQKKVILAGVFNEALSVLPAVHSLVQKPTHQRTRRVQGARCEWVNMTTNDVTHN